MFGSFKKKSGSGGFWTWLSANASRIRAGGGQAVGDIASELSNAFKKSYPDLVWEITPSKTSPWVFCVSADGNVRFFEAVKAAVAAAPTIPGWEIKAFRQRGSLDVVLEMGGNKLGYDDIWCQVEPEGQRARVTLLVRGLTADSAKVLLGAALVLLDNALGEYDSVMKISELGNGPLHANPARSQRQFPLSDLPAYLDSLGSLAHHA